jgi:hypothetical protein
MIKFIYFLITKILIQNAFRILHSPFKSALYATCKVAAAFAILALVTPTWVDRRQG